MEGEGGGREGGGGGGGRGGGGGGRGGGGGGGGGRGGGGGGGGGGEGEGGGGRRRGLGGGGVGGVRPAPRMPLALLEVADHVELELREVDPPPVQDKLMLREIQDRVVVDLELRGDEPGQPAVDRRGTEIVLRGVVRNTIELDRVARKQFETQRAHHRAVRRDVLDDQIDAPECRPHLHVQALDVEPAGGLDRRWRLAVVARQPGPAVQDALAAWDGVSPEMLPAPGEEEILFDESVADAVDPADRVEAGDRIEPVTQDPEGLARPAPPRLITLAEVGGMCRLAISVIAGPSAGL